MACHTAPRSVVAKITELVHTVKGLARGSGIMVHDEVDRGRYWSGALETDSDKDGDKV